MKSHAASSAAEAFRTGILMLVCLASFIAGPILWLHILRWVVQFCLKP